MGELSIYSVRLSKKPSKTVLALVSPGCTRAVTKMICRLFILTDDFVAVTEIFGTGKPEIVVHRSCLS